MVPHDSSALKALLGTTLPSLLQSKKQFSQSALTGVTDSTIYYGKRLIKTVTIMTTVSLKYLAYFIKHKIIIINTSNAFATTLL